MKRHRDADEEDFGPSESRKGRARKRREQEKNRDLQLKRERQNTRKAGDERFKRRATADRRERERLLRMAPSPRVFRLPDCPATGKRSYVSPNAALGAIEAARKYKKGDYYPIRSYQCEHCQYWHLTSRPMRKSS